MDSATAAAAEVAEPRKAGIFPDMSREAYDALRDRVNFSTAKWMGKSPAHYAHAVEHGGGPDTNPLKLGRVTHLAVFEPGSFLSGVEVWEGKARRGSAWEDFRTINEGRELVTQAEYFQCAAISKAIREHPVAGKYTRGGQGEVTLLWTHESPAIGELPGYALDCRARVDYLAPEFIADLKVVRDAGPEGFGRACASYRTYTQAAEYHDAVLALTGKDLPYWLLAVESTAPYVAQVYRVTEAQLAAGRAEYRSWFDRIHSCRRDGRYPGYAEAEMDLELPRWDMPPEDEEDLSETGLIFPEE